MCQKQLEIAIQDFLAHTAHWTPHLFNKPKFHILLHLVEHIRQFCPAALFATEGFESFNAVIRAKSIHSNRQSPSHDIARGFAHGNHIHHILSGAYIHICSNHSKLENQIKRLIERPPPGALNVEEAGTWWPTGIAPLELVRKPNIITDYLGMDSMSVPKKGVLTSVIFYYHNLISPGSCVQGTISWCPYHATQTGQQFPAALSSLSQEILHGNNFQICKSMILLNGDRCVPGQWVLVHSQNTPQPLIAQVKEIIQRQGSAAEIQSSPDAILLQSGKIQPSNGPYHMPAVQHDDAYLLLPIKVCA